MPPLMPYPDPAAIWSPKLQVFDKEISTAQNVLLMQGAQSLAAIINRIDRLHMIVWQPSIIDLTLDPDVPMLVSDICCHHGLASSILFNDSRKKHQESALYHRLRIERYKYVKDIMDANNLQTPLLLSRRLRNSLMHIEEHMTDAMRRPNTGWMVDAALHKRVDLIPPADTAAAFCRCYIREEDKIIHIDEEIQLSALRDEASAVLNFVFGMATIAPPIAPPRIEL